MNDKSWTCGVDDRRGQAVIHGLFEDDQRLANFRVSQDVVAKLHYFRERNRLHVLHIYQKNGVLWSCF